MIAKVSFHLYIQESSKWTKVGLKMDNWLGFIYIGAPYKEATLKMATIFRDRPLKRSVSVNRF